MPIYEYMCEACGHVFDKIQKVSDAPIKICPNCEAEGVQKKLSMPAFHLKGTGWYETDFKGKDKDKDKSKTKASESADPSKASTTDTSSSPSKTVSDTQKSKPATATKSTD